MNKQQWLNKLRKDQEDRTGLGMLISNVFLEDAAEYLAEHDKESDWRIVKYHVISDEERAKEEYPEDWYYYLDCLMPDDDDSILVVTEYHGRYTVSEDVCYVDEGFSLDSGLDWRDIIAWKPMPAYVPNTLEEDLSK